MDRGQLGQIVTPAAGNRVGHTVQWCGDNAVFAGKYPGDVQFIAWLRRLRPDRERCRFVVAADVVGDAAATLRRSAAMLPAIRGLGFPAALAAQNGLEDMRIPWDTFDALFLGGDTEWKLGPAARALTAEARHRGKWVHMGRVNSLRRLRYAHHIGCDSADGTFLAFGPDQNLPRLLGWLRAVNDQGTLFQLAGRGTP
jgi:hypothetical protein